MEWKRTCIRVTRWESVGGAFRISDQRELDGKDFVLESLSEPDKAPVSFGTLDSAKAHATTLNELALLRQDNVRLRGELARLQTDGSWEAHPKPEDFEPPIDAEEEQALADRERPLSPAEEAARDDAAYEAAVQAFERSQEDDGRGVPQTPRILGMAPGEGVVLPSGNRFTGD